MRTLCTRRSLGLLVLVALPLAVGVGLQAADLSHISNFTYATGYRGMVAANFDTTDVYDELLADFGGSGMWMYQHGAWTQVTDANPQWMFAVKWGNGGAYEVIADFGTAGLWVWRFPGTWTELTSANINGGFAVDDDGDGKEEIQVEVVTMGVWRYDNDTHNWIQLTASQPSGGIRCDLWAVGLEEGLWRFISGPVGLWTVWMDGGHVTWKQLSASTPTSDFAAADFIDSDGTDTHDELVVQFGNGVGTWIYDGDGGGTWTRITTTAASAMLPVKTGNDADWELLFADLTGHPWIWSGFGAGNGWLQLSSSFLYRAVTWDPDMLEPGEFAGETELAADFGSLGLWLWNHGVGTNNPAWTQLTTIDPKTLLAWDYYGDGGQTSIVANFGPGVGLWMYDGVDHRWIKMTDSVPEFSTAW